MASTTGSSTPPATARQSSPAQPSYARPRRNYQACLACKEQKVRCQLGSPDDPQPPCARCRRSRLECVFGPPRAAVRGTRRRRAKGLDSTTGSHLGPQVDPAPSDIPSVGLHAPATRPDVPNGSPAAPVPEPSRSYHGVRSHATSSSTPYSTRDRPGPCPCDPSALESEVRSRDLSAWAHFQLCREGWISPVEAEFLLQCYFHWMEPMLPLVDETYRDPSRRASLTTHDSVLCLAILTVASRYVWFEGTAASSRAHELHGLLFKKAQQGIQQSLWGAETDAAREDRVLSTIESILLFVEWRPRPLDVMPNQGDTAGSLGMYGMEPGEPTISQSSIVDEETQKAYMLTRRMNASSWRLLGHAVNLADEISLVEGLSKSRETRPRVPSNIWRRARIRDMLVPVVWETSFRLGRNSLLKLPKPSPTTTDEYASESQFAPLLRARAEAYRLCRLIENTMYSSLSATKEIVASDRHPEMISSLAEILNDWWNKFQQTPGPFGLRKVMEIQYHNIWMYVHAIAFQAIIERLRGHTAQGPDIQHFERSYRPQGLGVAEVLRSERSRRDIQLAEEIGKSSIRTLELCLDLEKEGYLHFIPFTTMTWVFTSATLLLKGSGLRSSMDANTADLLDRVSRALDRAVVDDMHAMAHFTSGLLFLIQRVQAGAATTRSGNRQSNVESGPAANTQSASTTTDLPPMDAENAAISGGITQEHGVLPIPTEQYDLIFPDSIADDWANWLSVGLDTVEGPFTFDIYSGFGAADNPFSTRTNADN